MDFTARAEDSAGMTALVKVAYIMVPRGAARARVQPSAAHTPSKMDRAVAAFVAAR